MGEMKVSMKLLINSQTNKVIFAEAGKECVDFLCHIMSLPIATLIRLLREQGMVACLGNLYKSVQTLNSKYQQQQSVLNKNNAAWGTTSVPLFLLKGDDEEFEKSDNKYVYKCGNCPSKFYANLPFSTCRDCGGFMKEILTLMPFGSDVVDSTSEGGFVKGSVGTNYMIMDDLVVKPMSTISSLTLINKMNVDVGALEEMEVQLGINEAVKLFKTSLQSKQVLTAVFLHGV